MTDDEAGWWRMEIEDLRVFVEVADAGGVNAAARRLGVAKSIVSRRLLRLEDELGVQLVARTTRGVVLTEAGGLFRDQAAAVCATIDNARDELAPAGSVRGLIRIAAPASFARNLAQVLVELAERHPALHVHARFNDRYVDLVGEGFDCGIRIGYLTDSNLIARKLGELPVRLYASPAYLERHGEPQAPSDILKHAAITPGADVWTFHREGETTPIRPMGRFKADNAYVIAEAAARGVGIAALGEIVAEPYVAEGALKPVMTGYSLPAVGIYVVRPPTPHVPRKLRVLIDLMADVFVRTCPS